MVQTTHRSADVSRATRILEPRSAVSRPRAGARSGLGSHRGPNRRLDGLIGIAAVVLLADGIGLPFSGGHLAVDMLLVCVGFRFARMVRNGADQERRTVRFWLHEIGPIVAPVLVVVGLSALYWGAQGSLSRPELLSVLGGATMTQNFLTLFAGAEFAALDHLWVVAIIAQFGLVAPLLVLRGRRFLSAERRASALLGLALGVAICRLGFLVTGSVRVDVITIDTLTRMDGLLLGLAVGVAPLPALRRRLPLGLAAPAFAMLLLFFISTPGPTTMPIATLGMLIPATVILTGLVVAWAATGGSAGALDATLDNQVLSWIGRRAISIYVWHQFFALIITVDGIGQDGDTAQWPGVGVFLARLVFTLAAAATSHRYLVMPAMAAATRFLARTRSSRSPATANSRSDAARPEPASAPPRPRSAAVPAATASLGADQSSTTARHPASRSTTPTEPTRLTPPTRFTEPTRFTAPGERTVAAEVRGPATLSAVDSPWRGPAASDATARTGLTSPATGEAPSTPTAGSKVTGSPEAETRPPIGPESVGGLAPVISITTARLIGESAPTAGHPGRVGTQGPLFRAGVTRRATAAPGPAGSADDRTDADEQDQERPVRISRPQRITAAHPSMTSRPPSLLRS